MGLSWDLHEQIWGANFLVLVQVWAFVWRATGSGVVEELGFCTILEWMLES